jgi:predicted dehydrogenase
MTFPTALPRPRTPDSIDAPPLRWGVLGTGWIAGRFVRALRDHTRHQVYAVGSRSLSSARSFVAESGFPEARVYGSYEELVADHSLDVVYVATPHHLHVTHALLAIAAGRNALVEKPMGLDEVEVARMTAAAERSGVLLWEALWSAYLPKFDVIRQLLDDGVLGSLHSVQADVGEYFPGDHRIMRAELAGGPRYDLLTYPRWFAQWVLGPPVDVREMVTPAPAELSPTGVEGQIAVVQRHAGNTVASLFASVLGDTPSTATVVGAGAVLHIDGPFFQPGGFSLRSHDGRELRYDEPRIAHDGLHYEAAAVARALASARDERTSVHG